MTLWLGLSFDNSPLFNLASHCWQFIAISWWPEINYILIKKLCENVCKSLCELHEALLWSFYSSKNMSINQYFFLQEFCILLLKILPFLILYILLQGHFLEFARQIIFSSSIFRLHRTQKKNNVIYKIKILLAHMTSTILSPGVK